jgi:AAA domain
MIERKAQALVEQRLARYPAVVLLGARQVGKTTLAQIVAARHPGALLLDMERESDRAAVAQPELFFPAHRSRLVVVDEVQHAPHLFTALRPEIDMQGLKYQLVSDAHLAALADGLSTQRLAAASCVHDPQLGRLAVGSAWRYLEELVCPGQRQCHLEIELGVEGQPCQRERARVGGSRYCKLSSLEVIDALRRAVYDMHDHTIFP